MGWPVNVGTIRVWRNDRWARSWPFYSPPPAWAPGMVYVEGVVGSGEYLANSSVSFGTGGDGLPVFYTCTTAHTSGLAFDPADWTLDPAAVGPPLDLTVYGSELAGQLRHQQDDTALASFDLSASDLPGGVITAAFTADMWARLEAETSAGWDIEIRETGELPLTVLTGRISILRDWTHDG